MKRSTTRSNERKGGGSTSRQVEADTQQSVGAADWRTTTLARIRALITQTDPDIVEEIKWRKPSNPAGVPVWSHPACGMICTGETYKDKVKLTFAKGAALEDPSGLFNASLDGATRRAIDIREGDTINEKAFKALIRKAIALDTGPAAKKATARRPASTRPRKKPKGA